MNCHNVCKLITSSRILYEEKYILQCEIEMNNIVLPAVLAELPVFSLLLMAWGCKYYQCMWKCLNMEF
jgi:hypothetical protein